MNQHNHAQQAQQPRKPMLQMPGGRREADEYGQSYLAMLNVMRRIYDLWGDLEIKRIIDEAERALAQR